ncbi:hypothetical protein RAAC3_TM7C00001G0206 [Candidatus Saccharibacteria bacterium RAAC3_TM7_1]|nr:hypothetical protein RAAC3_TM7C00001G0206 [Candidatus Saccharibacteria bacterium RAAC3_TM7_1]HCZ28756.1 prepilin-type N-terminal cleavage/methylation domain-containing protein [Candidatus Saccharibacteria bacterium]
MKLWAKHTGFTIVELLIVIVVIAILAAITIVAYSGLQQRTRDNIRKSDLTSIAKALKLYSVDNGPMWIGVGCGSNGNGSGWFNYNYSPSGMNKCLKTAGVIDKDIVDPSGSINCSIGSLDCHAYMKYTCSQGGTATTYVYANLETLVHTTSDTDGTCAVNLDTDYGMNYFVKITD